MKTNRVISFRSGGFFLGVAVILGALQSASGQTNRLPSTTLTTGGRFSDDVNLGVIDILQPVYSENNTMLLLNPRIAFNDVSEEEFNIGFVARHLLPEKNMIIGGNIFFDRRHTGFGNYFSQLGLGAEILTPMIDARFNVYIPDDDHKLVGEDEVTASSSTSSSRTSTDVSTSRTLPRRTTAKTAWISSSGASQTMSRRVSKTWKRTGTAQTDSWSRMGRATPPTC